MKLLPPGSSQGRPAAKARKSTLRRRAPRGLVSKNLPLVQQHFGPGTTFSQFRSLTRLRISDILHELPFWAILAVMAVFALVNGHFAGRNSDRNVYPVTFLMLQAVEGSAPLFFYLIATMYAGELIWRERDTSFSGIHDALPMRESTDWFSKFCALAFVELVLLTVVLFCGVASQTIGGYYHYELIQYVKELYLVAFPQIITFALAAIFFQTIQQ